MRLRVLVAYLVCAAPGFAQPKPDGDFDVRTRKGIEYVYNLEFENAEREFGDLTRLKPDHPSGHFFLAMVQWWKILTDPASERYDDEFHESLDHVVDMCDEMLDKNPNDVTALFFKGGAIGFQGRLYAHRSQWFAAANAGRKALPIVQDASTLDPGNNDVLLGTGIYNYYAEIIPREYPFVKPLTMFVPEGDRKKGIEQLTAAAEKGTYAGVEATYFLMQLYYQFERDYQKALALATKLHERFPNNMLFHKYLGRCFVSVSNWEMVNTVFGEISQRCRAGQRGYGDITERESEYYLGLRDLTSRSYDSALKHLYRADELSRKIDTDEQSGFMVMTNLKVGNIYDLQSRRDLAISQYRKVLGMKEYKDSYRQAEQFLKSPFVH